MKRMLALLLVAAMPLLASAQIKPVEPWSDIELSNFVQASILGTPTVSYDKIIGERVVYSGIAIQLFRAPNPLQLINPWAPKAYGPSEQNLVTDPVTKQPAGLRFFSINF